jgi:starvation-inducible DNA-binding protein
MNEELPKIAMIAFASTFSFYLKAANFHWNVTGPNFEQYHALFERIYLEVYGSIDDFAENIRKLNCYTPASLGAMHQLNKIADCDEPGPVETMVSELLVDSLKMNKLLKFTYDCAEECGEHGFSNFLAERMDAHRKHEWMLRSSLQGQQTQTATMISL